MLLNCENIKFKKYKLSEIFYIKNGYTPSTKNKDFWENGTIPWFKLEDIRQNGNILSDAIKHVTTKAIKGEKLFPADSIMLSTTATIGEHALIKVPCLGNQQLTFFSLKEGCEIDIKYMYYYFYLIDEWCKENTSPGTLKIVNMEELKTLEIELPSLEIQKRIVYILDNFETVCRDLKIGLPAEIEKRQIQYEYYRNMLLNLSEAIKLLQIGDDCSQKYKDLWKFVLYVFGYENTEMNQVLVKTMNSEHIEKTVKSVSKNICSGGTPYTENKDYYGGNIPWLRNQEVDFNEIIETEMTITEEGYKNSSATWIDENCLIIAMYGATVAKIAINRIPLTTNQACCNIKFKEDEILLKFAYYYFENEYSNLKELGRGSQGNINSDIIKNYIINLPNLDIQKK